MENNEMYRKAEARVKEKMDFYIHFAVYCVVMALLVFINVTTSPEYFWAKWPLLGWGIGVLFHGLNTFLLNGNSSIKKRMIEKEMERMKKE